MSPLPTWPTKDRCVNDCDPRAVATLTIMSGCNDAPYFGVDQAAGERPKIADIRFWDRVKHEADRIANWAIQGLAISGRARVEPETIVAAAIKVGVRNSLTMYHAPGAYPPYLVVSAPPPARHHHLIHPMAHYGAKIGPDDQGFLTSTGRYVGREEALKIALASGQPMIDHPSRHERQLFSEDLW